MNKYVAAFGFVVCALLLAGCGSPNIPSENTNANSTPARLGDKVDISLSDLLTKPRAELAALAEEWTTKIQLQEKARHEGNLRFALLPDLYLPLVVPVWQEAKYSAEAGFSLPPYASDSEKDVELALHLARFGDSEAARKLVAANDTETLKQIETLRYERAYPVEWTRLVGLLLHAAQIRLATGDIEGGGEIIALHQQLQGVLDPKAAKGYLGMQLLARGREALVRARAAWRSSTKTDLALQADSALAAWGEVPRLTFPINLGVARAQVNALVRSQEPGRAVLSSSPVRVLDLFALPFPSQGALAAIVCLDENDKFADVFITYRGGLSKYFPEPAHLAYLLEERSIAGEGGAKINGYQRRSYQVGDVSCEVAVVSQGSSLGALVHWSGGKGPFRPSLSRDFGVVHLDRSFESNRLHLAPEKRAETISTDQPKVLARITNPIPALSPNQIVVEREGSHNVLARLTLHYPVDESAVPPLHSFALPLWVALGPAQFQGEPDETGGHLALTWQDTKTRYTLCLPYGGGRPVQLEVADRQGKENVTLREAAAVVFDREERKARIGAGKPLSRISRHLERIELGLHRTQVASALPSGSGVFKRDIPDGVMVAFNGTPGNSAKYVARQIFVRFDGNRAAEIRVRFGEGPAAGKGATWMTNLLDSLKRRNGAPQEASAPWARLWPDLPPSRPGPSFYRWQDDVTALTYQRDSDGVELVLSDCPLAHETGVPLPSLEYLPRGPAECALGTSREEFFQKLGEAKPTTTEDGAIVVRPGTTSPYDALLVWFEKDRTSRIVARHSRNSGKGPTSTQGSSAVTEAWGREFRTLGWARRQDLGPSDELQSLGWHDDRTRVRIFWQEDADGSFLVFTEWQEVPSP